MIDRRTAVAPALLTTGLFVLVVLLAGTGTAGGAGGCQPISGPAVITQSGCYELTANVTDSPNETYIDIQANDVILDGNGYTVDGSGSYYTYGIFVNGSKTNRLSNVTVRNLTVTDWYNGVYVAYTDDGTIQNVSSSNNENAGFYLRGTNGVGVRSVATSGHDYDQGIMVVDSYNVSIEDLDSSQDKIGVRITNGHGVTVANSSFYNAGSGVKLSDSGGTLVKNSTFPHSGMIYLTNSNGTANRFVDNTASGDRWDGKCAGFWMDGADGDYFANNTLTGCSYGALVQHSNAVTLENNSIDISHSYSYDNYGIWLNGGGNHTLTNNTITNAGSPGYDEWGINLGGTIHATLSGNTLFDSPVNLRVRGSTWREVTHDIDSTNTVEGKPVYYYVNGSAGSVTVPTDAGYVGLVGTDGATVADISFPANNEENVYLWNADGTEIRNVTASGSRSAVWADYDSNDLVIEDSTFDDAGGIYLSKSVRAYVANTTIDYGIGNGVTLYQASDTTIENVTVRNVDDHGVMIKADSNDVTIAHSTFESNDRTVIYTYQNVGLTVTDNVIRNNGGTGILEYGHYSTNATIRGNVIANNDGHGVRFDNYATDTTIADNDIYGNVNEGLVFDYNAQNPRVVDNNISDNGGYGIDLSGNGNFATFAGNTISGHSVGLDLSSSFGNLSVYDNYFNNTQNVDIPDPTGLTNATWNTTNTSQYNVVGGPYTGGNFWAAPDGNGSSQTCADANLDGFCDTPFNVTTGHNDSLPLTTPPPNRPPFVTDDHYVTTENETLTIDAPGIFANDFDAEGDYSLEAIYALGNSTDVLVWANGSVAFTPTPGFTGTDHFSYRVVDEAGKVSRYATVWVDVVEDTNRAPVGETDNLTTFQGEPVTFSAPGVFANDYDPEGDSFSLQAIYTLSNSTDVLMWDNGTVTYTPHPDFVGTDDFAYRLVDEHGAVSDYIDVNVEVLPDPNRAPTAMDDEFIVEPGQTLSIDAPGLFQNDFDPDGDSYSLEAVYALGNSTDVLVWNNGTFTYTPNASFTGTDHFSYRLVDEHGAVSNYAKANITVKDVTTTAPVAVNDTYTVVQGETLSVDAPGLFQNDYDPNGDAFSLNATYALGNSTDVLIWNNGTFTYTPNASFTGTDHFYYTIEDANGDVSESATVWIDVVPDHNRAPVGGTDNLTTFQGEPVTFSAPGAFANDLDPDGDSFSLQAIYTLSNSTDVLMWDNGTVTYTPHPDFVGTDDFAYRLVDEHGAVSDYIDVNVEVLPDPNRPPTGLDDTITVVENGSATIDAPGLFVNDRDPDGDSLSVGPTYALGNSTDVLIQNNGSVTFTPTPGFVGFDDFSYKVRDEHGTLSDYVGVTVVVVNDSYEAPADVALSRTILDFGNVTIGDSVTKTVMVANVGADPLNVTDATISGVDADEFSVSDVGQFPVQSGEVETLTVTFTPDALGTQYATLTISSNDTDEPAKTVSIDGNGLAPSEPTIAVTPTSIDFGTLVNGTTATANVTIENLGNQTLTFENATIESAAYGYFDVVAGNVTTTLATGQTHEVTVEFAPTGENLDSATLQINSDDPDDPTASVSLSGAGDVLEPEVSVTPTSYDFGDVEEGTTNSTNVTIENLGDADLTIQSVSVVNSSQGYFSISPITTSTTVAPNGTLNVTATFAPTAINSDSATLQIATNDSDEATVNVSLVGNGIAGASPEIYVAPVSHDFGDVEVSSYKYAFDAILIKNKGDAPLNWTGTAITGTDKNDFQNVGTDSAIIQPQEVTTVSLLRVYSIDEGPKTATLEIYSNDTNQPTSTVTLTANIVVPEPNASVSPRSHDFGTVEIGQTATKAVTVTNDGTSTLTFDGVEHAGDSAFEVASGNGSTTIVPGDSHQFVLWFTPSTTGSASATFDVLSDDPDDPTVTVSVTGSGVQPTEPNLTVSPTTLDFGNVSSGSSTTANVTIGNDGTADLAFYGLSSETPSFAFKITAGNAPTVIAPGDSHNVTVQFTPLGNGSYADTLIVNTNGSYADVQLLGNGVDPNRAPVASADHYVTLEDQNLSVSVPGRLANDLDPNGDSFLATNHAQPSHGTLHAAGATGSFLYEPDQGFTGTDTFVYRVRDDRGAYSSWTVVTIEVLPDPNRAPKGIGDRYSVHSGETLTVAAPGLLDNDRDPDGDGFDATNFAQPTHGTLVAASANGNFEYEPDPWYTGTDSFTYRITDDHGAKSAWTTVTIDVLAPRNREPTAVMDRYSVSEGENLSVSAPGLLANDYDPDGDSLDATNFAQPTYGTLHAASTAGNFLYEPDPGFTGTDTFVYYIRDGNSKSSVWTTVTIEVVADNDAPTAVPDYYATLKDQNLSVSTPGILGNDYDLNNDSIDATNFAQPTHGTLHAASANGNFEYEPDPGFTGTDSFTYRIQDDRGTDSEWTTVTIEVVDPAGMDPVGMPDNYTVYEDETLTVGTPGNLGNDLDPNGDSVEATNFAQPTHGTLLSASANGNFEYEPDPGFVGTDSFIYQITDDSINNNKSAWITVTIEVLPNPDTTGNHAPTVVDDRYPVFEGETLTVSVPGILTNDYDIDNDSFDATNFAQPTHGTLVAASANGNFEYEPDSGFTGTDSFPYRITDEHGTDSTFGTVTIDVVPDPNRSPEGIDDRYSVFEGETLTVAAPGLLDNDRDPDGDGFDAINFAQPTHGTLVAASANGNFEYEPDSGFTGTDSFVYRIEDDHGAKSAWTTVTVEVLPDPNRAPMVVPDHYAVLAGETLTVSTPGLLGNDYDLDNDSFDATGFAQPTHGTLVAASANGNFEYQPDPGFTGTDSFVYRVTDEHGNDSTYVPVTITVVNDSATGLADVVVSKGDIDFGQLPAGTNVTETVTVANIGSENLTFHGAWIWGTNASAFDVTAGNETTVLGYGGTTSFTVEYAPSLGPADAMLTVVTDDPDEQMVNVTLSGEGYDASAPTIHTVAVAGSYVNDSDPNGSLVYENETVAFEVNATDEFGTVQDVTVTLDAENSAEQKSATATENTTTGNWTTTIDVSTLGDGRYDVTVEAADDAGNQRTVVSNDTVVVDTVAPPLSAAVARINATDAYVTVRTPGALQSGSLDVEVEQPGGTVVSVGMTDDGDVWNGTFALPEDGQYNLTVNAIDLAGNHGSDTATARFATESTDNNTITVQMQPSGLFVRFTTNRSVNNTYISMTESNVPVSPLVNGQAPVNFLDAVIDKQLTENLSYATIGIPVDTGLLSSGTDVDDVSIRYYNETRGQWTLVPTTIEEVTVNGTTDEYWVATVAHFSTYGAVATDTTPPTVTSLDPVDGHAFASGTTARTLRVEYEDALSDVDTSQVTVTYDGTIVNGDPATTITSDYVEYEATGLTDGSSHELEVSVADTVGNEHTETLSFTVEASSGGGGSGGGSGGGGGGGGSVPPPSVLLDVTDIDGGVLVTVQNGRPGATGRTSLSVGEDGIDFAQIDLSFARETDPFTVELKPGGSAPAGAPELTGAEAFRYFDVNVAGASDADLDHAVLRFRLDENTLPEGGSLRDVSVYRFHDGSWERLETSRSGDLFKVTTPGFSTFAISIDQPAFAVGSLTADSSTVEAGSTVSFDAEVRNDGAGDGRYDATLLVDGESVATQTVRVDAGDSETVTFEHVFDAPGTYEVSVGDQTMSVTVESAGTEAPDQPDGTATPDEGQPGFGLVVAVLGLLAAALFALRRD